MKMRIPKRVNVLGHEYKVIYIDRAKFEARDGRSGECEYPTRIIRIAKDLKASRDFAWLVFLHELRHAYQFECGLTQILERQVWEKDCELFASFITSLQKQGVL